MWLKLFVLLALTKLCALQKVDYDYEELDLMCSFELLSENYGCNIKNLIVLSRDARIQDVTGIHKPGRSNEDVMTIYSYNSGSKYIPKRLGFLFTNLKTLLITKSNLRLFEFRDFKNMKKLQKLYLTENKIEKIPACVFKYSVNLEIIDLSGNQITDLNEDTFINLPNLQQFYAKDNCIKRLEQGLFRNNLNLRRISLQQNELLIIEINFMKIKSIELVDLRQNACINMSFGCCKGPAMREFMNQTNSNCRGPESLLT